jgi:SAM-dependent methyltransferase
MPTNPNVDIFDRDASSHGGYLYTKTARLSSQLATQRTTDIILETGRFAGRSVLDMACGDGFYTMRFWDNGKPRAMVGVDAAPSAIEVAKANRGERPIEFLVGDVHKLPWRDNQFDLVLIQSILHHDDNPAAIIREAFRLAPEILIHEPNGNNFGVKLFERLSKYHREHHEKSYTTRRLRRWIREAGGKVVYQRFAGFVPIFCSDWVAQATKAVEPLVERIPVINALGCAVVVLIGRREGR